MYSVYPSQIDYQLATGKWTDYKRVSNITRKTKFSHISFMFSKVK